MIPRRGLIALSLETSWPALSTAWFLSERTPRLNEKCWLRSHLSLKKTDFVTRSEPSEEKATGKYRNRSRLPFAAPASAIWTVPSGSCFGWLKRESKRKSVGDWKLLERRCSAQSS